ncbi:hypothetical protein AKJ09_08446 [Labilithrix luteola]|uniref:Uncharacterized protein n=1 Tax=Labilithrix luteola TaxID=1391654 RepID=A0A0K1Q7R6_9BACT|nr:hypothetical protein [Labilithrix luteola]AKV01783.1 hypothetical protein AKJ09_08446 [Labilithrix luteola]
MVRAQAIAELPYAAYVTRAALVTFLALLAAGASVTSMGCSGGALETATSMPSAPRRPDGVVLEPPAALPAAVDRAPASGVVALREPLGDKDIDDVVRAYVRAFEHAELDTLKEMTARDATTLGRSGDRNQLIALWAAKLKSADHAKLSGAETPRLGPIEKHTFDTLGELGSAQRPPTMREGDVYVRVPISVPRTGGEPLFGDVLVLLLRREDGRLRIAGQADENAN